MQKTFKILIALASLLVVAYFLSVRLGSWESNALNVYGEKLQICCTDPMTGFYRNGKCFTGPDNEGMHIICAVINEDFLNFTLANGNDLKTPKADSHFPGLQSGDCWCLSISRWIEAKKAGKACPIKLSSTHIKTLEYISLEELEEFAKSY